MMDKKVKILVLVNNLDSGTGTFTIQMLGLKKNFNIIVGALEHKHRLVKQMGVKIYYFSNDISHINYYSLGLSLSLQLLKEIKWVNKIVNREHPQIILGTDLHSNLLAAIGKVFLRQNAKTILTTHVNLPAVIERKASGLLKQPLLLIGNYFYSRADAVVCVSRGVAGAIRKLFSFRREIITIPYGLDAGSIKIKSRDRVSKDEDAIFKIKATKRIISIGRFDAQKDFSTLIRAFSLVKKKLEDVELLLLGDGYQRDELERLVQDLGLQSCIHFLGWKANVYPYIKRSDVFVLSSRYEGFGYVLLEAMFLGIPVVSTDAPFGPREVLDNGKYGILVPVGNVETMTKAIIKLLKDKAIYKQYSQKSRERIKSYTEEKMLNSYKNIILNLLR